MAAKLLKIRSSTDSTSPGDSKKVTPLQYKFIFLGSHHKASLFDKLIEAVDKYERHVQYPDVWYLNLEVDGKECIIELNDPGVRHTGAREMAIRKADAIILCYSAMSVASFHQLSSIAEDFKMRKEFKYPPVRVICNEDDVIEDDIETASIADQSSSEGYESEDGSVKKGMRKRRSMERIVEAHEQNRITREQGETMAKLFGPDSEFYSLSVSSFTEARKMLEDLIKIINEKNPAKAKIINKEKKRERSSSIHSAKISPSNSIKSEPPSTPTSDISRRSSIKKLTLKKGNSTVCTIS